MSITLNIPESSRSDQIWSISVSGVSSGEQITLAANMTGLFGNVFASSATFIANNNGIVDLHQQAPVTGSYSGIDPMGLIWSMQCEGVHGLLSRRFDLSAAKIDIQVKNKENKVLIEKRVTRYIVEPNVSITSIRKNDLVGTLYQPAILDNKKLPALIVLSGSEGGFRDEQAALLASQGYAAFALAYFIPDQTHYTDLPDAFPSDISKIPLEYFEKAIQFLQQQPNIDPNNIGVIGTSRGGELALLLGSVFSQLKCVVAYVPNHAVQAAFGPSNHTKDEVAPAWTYGGKAIPCFPLKVDRVDWFSGKPVVLKNGFLTTSSSKDVKDTSIADACIDAVIPVEKINGPLLLISAGDDEMWPSQTMSTLIMKRLQEKGHKYVNDSQHITYEKAGHLIMVPWWPTTGQHAIHPVDKVDYAFGGTPQADAHAGSQSWEAIKAFLAKKFELPYIQ